jgi:hypothetical protein
VAVEVELRDVADVETGHADVGRLGEQRGLRDVRLHAVALRPQRDDAAERHP